MFLTSMHSFDREHLFAISYNSPPNKCPSPPGRFVWSPVYILSPSLCAFFCDFVSLRWFVWCFQHSLCFGGASTYYGEPTWGYSMHSLSMFPRRTACKLSPVGFGVVCLVVVSRCEGGHRDTVRNVVCCTRHNQHDMPELRRMLCRRPLLSGDIDQQVVLHVPSKIYTIKLTASRVIFFAECN